MNPSTNSEEPTLEITRIFNAPRELVFKVWTDPLHIMYWWGPANFTAPSIDVDFQPGGEFHYCMRSPDGKDYWSKGVYYQIIVPEKIVSTMYFSDEDGDMVSPVKYGMGADVPSEMLDTITFEEYEDNKTKFTFNRNTPISISKRIKEDEGWNQSLDKFEKEVTDLANRSIVISRILNFPRERVFQAWTDSHHLEKWWGPEGFTATTEKFDFKPDGGWRHIMHGPDGTDYDNNLVYLEIAEPERIIYTNSGGDEEEYSKFHTTVTFTEQDSKTKLTMHAVFVTEEECRKNKNDYGAVEGGNQTLQRLDKFLLSDR
jgi:uncharacterized protein YndB with AHSA1/START domain